MNIKKTALATALATVMGFSAIGAAQAAAVVNGDTLTITQGSQTTVNSVPTSTSGSYFAMDTNGNTKIAQGEKVVIGQGTTGLVIGVSTSAGASHTGAPTAGDTNAIDAPWGFFGNTGSDYTTVGVTGDTTAGLGMSGWTVTWSGIPAIPMGTGAWTAVTGAGSTGAQGAFTNGVGRFAWDGVYGDAYTLDYHATVPNGDPSGFGNVFYELHLQGVVNQAAVIPVPAAAWLFGSGLMGLVGIARRRKAKQV